MTIGDLKKQLEGWADDAEIRFGNGLEFYRLIHRSGVVQMEFIPAVDSPFAANKPVCGRCGQTRFGWAQSVYGGISGVSVYCTGCGTMVAWSPKPR